MPGLANSYLSVFRELVSKQAVGQQAPRENILRLRAVRTEVRSQGCHQTLMATYLFWLGPSQVPWLVECYGSGVANTHQPKPVQLPCTGLNRMGNG